MKKLLKHIENRRAIRRDVNAAVWNILAERGYSISRLGLIESHDPLPEPGEEMRPVKVRWAQEAGPFESTVNASEIFDLKNIIAFTTEFTELPERCSQKSLGWAELVTEEQAEKPSERDSCPERHLCGLIYLSDCSIKLWWANSQKFLTECKLSCPVLVSTWIGLRSKVELTMFTNQREAIRYYEDTLPHFGGTTHGVLARLLLDPANNNLLDFALYCETDRFLPLEY